MCAARCAWPSLVPRVADYRARVLSLFKREYSSITSQYPVNPTISPVSTSSSSSSGGSLGHNASRIASASASSTIGVRKRTKIVATLGPASCTPKVIRNMLYWGMDVARINFSHETSRIRELVAVVRGVASSMGVPLAVIGDLRGPRVRIGPVKDGQIQLVEGEVVCFTQKSDVIGTKSLISMSHNLSNDLKEGQRVLIDDGNLEVVVEKFIEDGAVMQCRVKRGGILASRKGMNFPGQRLSIPSLSDKDMRDIDVAIELGMDFLALSFVQTANDVRELKDILSKKNASFIGVVSKIETRSGYENIAEIAEESAAVMVARGDLALEMSIADIPIAQKRIISTCRSKAIPTITATQMLESMTHASKPTRAEATDVANAIFDGTDAVMLSGESAIGDFPEEAVKTLSLIAIRTEKVFHLHSSLPPKIESNTRTGMQAALAQASAMLSTSLSASCIAAFTDSGRTIQHIANLRPSQPILALTTQLRTIRRLSLVWGVECFALRSSVDRRDMGIVAANVAINKKLVRLGDILLVVGIANSEIGERFETIKVIPIDGTLE